MNNTTKVNSVTKLIAWTVVGMLAATIAVVIGMIILGAGHAHAGTQAAASYAVIEYAQRGGHGGHRS